MKPLTCKIAAVLLSLTFLSDLLPASALAATGDFAGELYGKDPSSALHDGGSSTCFGWADDKDAPLAYPDGSYLLRDRGDWLISFGFTPSSPVEWSLSGGYYPCPVSVYKDGVLSVRIESFSDLLEADGRRYEIAYTRLTVQNTGNAEEALPPVPEVLIPLNDHDGDNSAVIAAGETLVREYCVGADRFGGDYDYPADAVLAAAGSYATHFEHMTAYWDGVLSRVVNIIALPASDADLIEAYKAGYIYQLIVADNGSLFVGENGYDIVYYADLIEMLAAMISLGDKESFLYYADTVLEDGGLASSPNGRMKASWPFALYLKNTGDSAYLAAHYDTLRQLTFGIVQSMIRYEDAVQTDGRPVKILGMTGSTDADGYWLADNWIALFGLTTFGYICKTLHTATGEEKYEADLEWITEAYTDLKSGMEFVIQLLMTRTGITYLPMDLLVPNEESTHADPRDANWGVALMTGRWAWDGYLFGAAQEPGLLDMIGMIDQTYAWCLSRREPVTDSPFNAGGFPGYFYSSAYNAGYGSAALRGETYRTWGLAAYRFMLDHTMAGPYAWFESMSEPDAEKKETTLSDMVTGNGSSPHMWGQAVSTKMLLDALIAERIDDAGSGASTILIGRGIPDSWIASGEAISLDRFPLSGGHLIGYTLTGGEQITLRLHTDSTAPLSLELPCLVGRIAAADGGGQPLSFDNAAGTVAVPGGTSLVTVTLKDSEPADPTATGTAPAPAKRAAGLPGWATAVILAFDITLLAAVILLILKKRRSR